MTSFYAATVLGSSLYLVLWLFVLYSVLGVVIECAFFVVGEGVLESRAGLLYLPLRPLYGLGGVGFTLLLHPVVDQPVLVFLLGALVATVVEYVVSLVTEKAFGAVAWDYSDKVLNLKGRVCLQYSLCWGVLALVAMYLVDRPLRNEPAAVPSQSGEVLLTGVLGAVLLAAVLTSAALVRTRIRVALLRAQGSGSEAADDQALWSRLVGRLVPDRVLIDTFPRLSSVTELMELTGQQRGWIRMPWHRAGTRRATTRKAGSSPRS